MKILKQEMIFFKRELQKNLLISLVIGLFLGVVFYLFSTQNEEFMLSLFDKKREDFQEITYGGLEGWIRILTTNLTYTIGIIIAGFIPFCFLSLWIGLFSFIAAGIAFGYITIFDLSIVEGFFIGFLPHAIVELLAILYSISLGIYICKELTKLLLHKAHRFSLKNIVCSYVTVIVPLLLLAAIIEITVSRFFYI